jgi:hypothetical protein
LFFNNRSDGENAVEARQSRTRTKPWLADLQDVDGGAYSFGGHDLFRKPESTSWIMLMRTATALGGNARKPCRNRPPYQSNKVEWKVRADGRRFIVARTT